MDINRLNEIFDSASRLSGEVDKYTPREIIHPTLIIDESESDEEIIVLRKEYEYKAFKEYEIPEKSPGILALDTSSIRLGDTPNGFIAAYRVSIVIQGTSNKCYILGPYIMNIDWDHALNIVNYLRRRLGLPKISKRSLPSGYKIMDRIRNFIERIIQLNTTSYIRDGYILWDGSLMGGTVDTPRSIVYRAVSRAYRYGNRVIGVSKSSVLKDIYGNQLLDLISPDQPPGYIDVHSTLTPGIRNKCIGHVFIAKFRADGPPFRTDVASRDTPPNITLEKFYREARFYRGYPDALRTAHLMVAFKRNEIVALQSYLMKQHRYEIGDELNIRRYILSPFT